MGKWYEKGEVIPKSLTTHTTAAQALSPSVIWSLHSKDSKFTGELGHPKSQKILCREIYLVHANMPVPCWNANLPYCHPKLHAWHTNKQGVLILTICVTDCFPHCELAWLQLCRHRGEMYPVNDKLANPLGDCKMWAAVFSLSVGTGVSRATYGNSYILISRLSRRDN